MTDRQQPRPIHARLELTPADSRQRALAGRLEDGYGRIDQALREGADIAAWEEFWVQLLHQYEAVCDDRQLAA